LIKDRKTSEAVGALLLTNKGVGVDYVVEELIKRIPINIFSILL